MGWFAMPVAVLDAYVQTMPVLRARETLRLSSTVSLGAGRLSEADSKSMYRSLRSEAGLVRQRVVRAPGRASEASDLAHMGIAVKAVYRTG